jgi:hypothetical protein
LFSPVRYRAECNSDAPALAHADTAFDRRCPVPSQAPGFLAASAANALAASNREIGPKVITEYAFLGAVGIGDEHTLTAGVVLRHLIR